MQQQPTWQPTGTHMEAEMFISRVPPYNPEKPQHLWAMASAYKIDPERIVAGESIYLDQENIIVLGGPACYYCATEYNKRTATSRCPGRTTE